MVLLSDKYRVQKNFLRSTRLDSNATSLDLLDNIVLHKTGVKNLKRLITGIKSGSQRAFTWTGPYGAGKSTLALFISEFLKSSKEGRESFISHGRKTAVQNLVSSLGNLDGEWVVLTLSGERTNPKAAIATALSNICINGFSHNRKEMSDTKICESLIELSKLCTEKNAGLLLIVDEMGKYLEFAAETNGDLHIFQQIAEVFARAESSCGILGILHQTFDAYASRIDQEKRSEWAKIQGRYEDISFKLELEESLVLISKAIKGPKTNKKVHNLANIVAEIINKKKDLTKDGLQKSLARVAPLHPLTALILVLISRQRFGQNERSIFSFLASQEPYGFKEYILSNKYSDHTIYSPELLFDYLDINLSDSILASPKGQQWAELQLAASRAALLGEVEVRITKVVGLLDAFGKQLNLRSSHELVASALMDVNDKKLKSALSSLQKNSIVIYRKHLSAYAISEGSDIDVEEEIELAKRVISHDWDTVKTYLPKQASIVANRHYHKTGTMRCFDFEFMTIRELEKLPHENVSMSDGKLIILVPEHEHTATIERNPEVPLLENISNSPILDNIADYVIVGIAGNREKLREIFVEIASIQKITNELKEIETDRAARKELKARQSLCFQSLDQEISRHTQEVIWKYKDKIYPAAPLPSIASDLADKIYPASPHIMSELINKDKISGSATLARRLLMIAMANNGEQENLGFQKFPPEMGLYLNVLRRTNLHKKNGQGVYEYSHPNQTEDPANLLELWSYIDNFRLLGAPKDKPVNIGEIIKALKKPPFGVRAGLLPVILLTYILDNKSKLAVYVDGIFEPNVGDFLAETLAKQPNKISIRHLTTSASRKRILKQMQRMLVEVDLSPDTPSSLHLASELAQFTHRLNSWSQRTERVSLTTIKVRTALLAAHDPEDLLFNSLPTACGFEEGLASKQDELKFIEHLKSAITELSRAYEGLKSEMVEHINDCFGISKNDPDALNRLRLEAKSVSEKTGNIILDSSLERLHEAISDEKIYEKISSLAAQKPMKNWSDGDIITAKIAVRDLANRLQDLFHYSQHETTKNVGQELFLVKRNNNSAPKASPILRFNLTPNQIDKIDNAKTEFNKSLQKLDLNKNELATMLADTLEKLMRERIPLEERLKQSKISNDKN